MKYLKITLIAFLFSFVVAGVNASASDYYGFVDVQLPANASTKTILSNKEKNTYLQQQVQVFHAYIGGDVSTMGRIQMKIDKDTWITVETTAKHTWLGTDSAQPGTYNLYGKRYNAGSDTIDIYGLWYINAGV